MCEGWRKKVCNVTQHNFVHSRSDNVILRTIIIIRHHRQCCNLGLCVYARVLCRLLGSCVEIVLSLNKLLILLPVCHVEAPALHLLMKRSEGLEAHQEMQHHPNHRRVMGPIPT